MEDVKQVFQNLKAIINEDTVFSSSTTVRYEHWANKAILLIGKPMISVILEDIQTEPHWWFHTLYTLTGVWPCSKENAGCLVKLTEEWIEWGKKNGFLTM